MTDEPRRKQRPGRYGKVYADILTEEKLHELMKRRKGKEALATWALSTALTAKELSDGVISRNQMRTIYGTATDAANLVAVGLWDEHDKGWYLHNYVESGAGITSGDVERLKRSGEVSACKGRMRLGKSCTCGEHNPPGDPVGDPLTDPPGDP